jgi:hypothetical protein
MPAQTFDEWLVLQGVVGQWNGNHIYLWLSSRTVQPAIALFENKDEAVTQLQYAYGLIRNNLAKALTRLTTDRPAVASECNDLADILNAGLKEVELAEAIAAKADAKWAVRVALDQDAPNPKVFYRKMSQGEYGACTKNKDFSFEPTFKYTDTDLYRYWMSSSLKKVQAFGNENKADDGDVIVQFTFSHSLTDAFESKLRPHQQKGVQGDKTLVALHREGFAQRGNLTDTEEMKKLIRENKNYNLGFTRTQLTTLKQLLSAHTRVKT